MSTTLQLNTYLELALEEYLTTGSPSRIEISELDMADALEKLKKKRRTYRATTTKTVNKIDDILKQEDVDVIRIQQLLSDIREKLGTLKELDDGILEIMFENNDDEACEKEAEEANEIREKVTYNIFLLEEALKKNSSSTPQTKPNLQRSSSLESVSSIESSTSSARGYHRKVKLPQLELKKFSGNIPEWQEFWDGFKSAIHDDEDLAKVDKFKYLRCYLEEPARSVITGFALTDANYDAAVDLLTKRFGKKNVIKRALINDLINLPAVFSEKNANRLRILHDQIETKFRAMEAQEIDKESYSSVVVPVLMSKIPESIRNNMIRFGDNHMEWNLGEMLVAFEKELDVLEGHFPIMNQPFPQTGAGRRAEMKHHSTTTTAALLTERENPSGNDNKKCLFCHAFHESTKCQKIKDPEDRKKILVKTARCFVCLKQGHRAFKCKLRKECSLCRKNDHHVSICPNLGHVKDSLRNDTAPSAPFNPQASSWVGSTGSEGGVALQTALAVVNDKRESKVRVLFDTGSHKTFITEKAVCENELRPVRKEILGIKAFGSREADVAERDVVELLLSPLNGGKNVFIEAFVVKDISSIPNIHVESVKHDYEHLKHVWFSDYCRKQDRLEIDCLIGSDWIWSFQEGRTIRGGQQEPVAVETSLGWVLSGPLKGKKLDHIYSSDCQVNFCIDETSKFSSVGNLDLDYKLNRLWDLDSIGIREANKVHEGVLDNIKFTGHRYSVGLPWKLGHKPLPTNYNISMLRMKSQVRKLRLTPIILKKYDEIISQQVEKGIIEQVAEKVLVWQIWLEDLRETRTISFPRCVLEDRKGDVFSNQLHGFADASQKAYCAMVYLVTEQRTFTKLLSAKTRVAPLKPLSIPRLELMSARVLATLMDTVKNALSPQIQFDKVKYWLDSKTALFWIYNNGEWKQFVQHRVNEILSLTSKEDWAHVAGTDNPADLGSRGVSATLLKNSRLWWEGPTWLCEDESKWPKFSPSVDSADIEVERRKNATSLFTTNTDRVGVCSIVDVERHGTLGKLLRVTAFVLRFINNLRGRSMNKVLNIGNLSTEEIEAAEHVWIKVVQKALRNRQDFQALSVQLGIVDQSGVLVCKGRLENADLDIGSKYPIIIPKDHRFTDLVIEDCHKRVFHNKLRSTLAELRSRFWVPRGRQQVKRVLNRCLTCKWFDTKALAAPNTAPLPDFRVAKSLPFSNTGIDFAGPLFVKTGQGDMRKTGRGKPETLSRPLQRLIPLEISVIDNAKKERKDESMLKANDELREDGKKDGVKGDDKSEGRPTRAAALDARWRARLMLDP